MKAHNLSTWEAEAEVLRFCFDTFTAAILRWDRDIDFPPPPRLRVPTEWKHNASLSPSRSPNNLPNPKQHRRSTTTTTTPLCSNFSGVECVAYVGNSTVVMRRGAPILLLPILQNNDESRSQVTMPIHNILFPSTLCPRQREAYPIADSIYLVAKPNVLLQ